MWAAAVRYTNWSASFGGLRFDSFTWDAVVPPGSNTPTGAAPLFSILMLGTDLTNILQCAQAFWRGGGACSGYNWFG
jgi:hypothetical protein